ncbi:MAG: hypothetical protein DRP08_06135, partial [Candidatus Aenigmatarchaeota archaeon]
MKTLEVLEEESYEYEGPLDLCGGGGTSSTIEPKLMDRIAEMIDNGVSYDYGVTVHDLIDAATSGGGNPYAGEEAYDPSGELDELESWISEFKNDIGDSPINSWKSYVSEVSSVLGTFGLDEEMDIEEIANRISGIAASRAASMIRVLSEASSSELSTYRSAYSDVVDEAFSKLADELMADSDLASVRHLIQEAIALSESVRVAVERASESAVEALREQVSDSASDGVEKAKSILGAGTGQLERRRHTLVNAATGDVERFAVEASKVVKAHVEEMLDKAMTKTASLFNSVLVSQINKSVGIREIAEHSRRLNRFTAGMDEMQAVQTSTYIFGLAILESEFERSVELSKAEVSRQVLSLFPTFIETLSINFANLISRYIESLRSNLEELSGVDRTISEVMLAYISTFVESYFRSSAVELDNVKSVIGTTLQSVLSVGELKSRLAYGAGGEAGRTYGDLARLGVDMFEKVYIGDTDRETRVRMTEKELKARVLDAGVGRSTALKQLRDTKVHQLAAARVELSRIKIASFADQTLKNLQIDVGYAKWDFEAFQAAAGVLAASGGGVTASPSHLSPGEGAFSGAMAGASAMLATGNPYAVAAGAVVGGLGGYLT